MSEMMLPNLKMKKIVKLEKMMLHIIDGTVGRSVVSLQQNSWI